MRIRATTEIVAPARAVWDVITDPVQVMYVLHGTTLWEPQGEGPAGLGSRYRVRMKVGSAEIGGLIEIVEWDPGRDMAWTSVTGIDQRGRWRLRERVPGRTHVELRFAGGVAGAGLAGWVAERVGSRYIADNTRRSVVLLKQYVEMTERRRAAERRRATSRV